MKTPVEVLHQEDVDSCIASIIELCTSATGYPPLEIQMIRRLLFNHYLWCRTTVGYQLALARIQISYVRAAPAKFRQILDIANILDTIRERYLTEVALPTLPRGEVSSSSSSSLQRSQMVNNTTGGGGGSGSNQGTSPPRCPTTTSSNSSSTTTSENGREAMSLIRSFRSSAVSQPDQGGIPLPDWILPSPKEREVLRRTLFQVPPYYLYSNREKCALPSLEQEVIRGSDDGVFY